MIKQELLEEVINVSANKKIIPPDLLIKIIESVIDGCSNTTKEQFNGIKMIKENKKEEKNNAIYDCGRKEIKIYYLNIVRNGLFFEKYNIFETNLYMLQSILHEIEHLKSDTDLSISDFEKKLFNYSLPTFIQSLLQNNLNDHLKKYENSTLIKVYFVLKTNIFYNQNYSLLPCEKLAEANSRKILLDSVDEYHNFKINNPNEYKFILKTYYFSLLMGYKYNKKQNEYNVPLLQYLEKLNKIDTKGLLDNTILDEIKNVENYSLEDRMKYGLQIDENTIKLLRKKYHIEN